MADQDRHMRLVYMQSQQAEQRRRGKGKKESNNQHSLLAE
jgi:hypothetical protein